ncbi:uncharacterized protein LOC119837197 [Zerene cesonia]|uniref:uncharacterized protein LOC119837197 n=1 Tax=Zerene cesonia TaxID=33412 RepID=UPI0018E5A440|nr:uncharacterized protein LOC119837197 [Zerene cesonia]
MVVCCSGYAEYEFFKGFDATGSTLAINTDIINVTNSLDEVTTSRKLGKMKQTSTVKGLREPKSIVSTATNKISVKNKTTFKCPEKESPKNIGPYEVPTQRDLVMLTKNILLKLYYSYNQHSLQLLKDIKEATKAALKNKCNFNKKLYTQCVRNVSKQCERFTKDTLMNLEAQKHDVVMLTEERICILSDLKTDPLRLIKLIAEEKSLLHFTLPGFLILLHSCNMYCSRQNTRLYKRKPLRHMTDQDLVISHLLTKKSYIQLINDSKHKV